MCSTLCQCVSEYWIQRRNHEASGSWRPRRILGRLYSVMWKLGHVFATAHKACTPYAQSSIVWQHAAGRDVLVKQFHFTSTVSSDLCTFYRISSWYIVWETCKYYIGGGNFLMRVGECVLIGLRIYARGYVWGVWSSGDWCDECVSISCMKPP